MQLMGHNCIIELYIYNSVANNYSQFLNQCQTTFWSAYRTLYYMFREGRASFQSSYIYKYIGVTSTAIGAWPVLEHCATCLPTDT